MKRPFRILAAFLLVLAALEVMMICNTPTYEDELREAKEALYRATEEHEKLSQLLR